MEVVDTCEVVEVGVEVVDIVEVAEHEDSVSRDQTALVTQFIHVFLTVHHTVVVQIGFLTVHNDCTDSLLNSAK